jgi:hypothetical protein
MLAELYSNNGLGVPIQNPDIVQDFFNFAEKVEGLLFSCDND